MQDPGYGLHEGQGKTLLRSGLLAGVTGGLSLVIGGGMILQDNRQARKAYEKQVALTKEAVAEQQKRELMADVNAQKSLARTRGLEIMFKTGMLDAPSLKG